MDFCSITFDKNELRGKDLESDCRDNIFARKISRRKKMGWYRAEAECFRYWLSKDVAELLSFFHEQRCVQRCGPKNVSSQSEQKMHTKMKMT